jgi:hypothetical protein
VITGPSGLPLDVGRAQRTATAAIRRAVELRDGHCVFTGCTAPAAWCDVHHVIHWAHGGPTSCDNFAHPEPILRDVASRSASTD